MNMEEKTNVKSNRRMFLFLRRHAKTFLAFCVCSIAFLAAVDYYVGSFSGGRLFRDVNDIPHRRAALVLGCNKYFDGRLNLFYIYRINSAVELWNSGKVDAILVSGDNSRKGYDEPTNMKADLVAKGVPAEYITIDYAGFRTLDSIVRAEKVFNLEDYIIVSQPFHCSRAIYLASQYGQNVLGYCARDVYSAAGLKIRLREVFARNKALFDILIHKNPKYLGKQEIITYKIAAQASGK
jgi:SanA protein